MTNADKIRQMTDEELADFIDKGCEIIIHNVCDEMTMEDCYKRHGKCTNCWLEWLRKEANDG